MSLSTSSQTPPTEPTTEGAFSDLVDIARRLGAILPAALAARYEAPPGGAAHSGGLTRNPTLDVVVDPRRWELSLQVSRTNMALRAAYLNLQAAHRDLDRALSAWEGAKPETAQ